MPKEYNFDFRKPEDQEAFEKLPNREKTRLVNKSRTEALEEDTMRSKKAAEEKEIELKKDIEELFSIVKQLCTVEDLFTTNYPIMRRLDKEYKEIRKRILSLEEIKFKTPEEFFNEIDILDQNVKGLEQSMGMPIDLCNPIALSKLLESIEKLAEDNKQAFLAVLDKPSELDSSQLFFALYDKFGSGARLNWPAKLALPNIFTCRVVARHFINELKICGFTDENLERIILDAFPFTTNRAKDWERTDNTDENVTAKIKEMQQQRVNDFYSLKEAEEISKIAEKIKKKLFLLDMLGHEDKLVEEIKEHLDLSLLNPAIKEVAQRHQGNFLNHSFPYAKNSLDQFFSTKEVL